MSSSNQVWIICVTNSTTRTAFYYFSDACASAPAVIFLLRRYRCCNWCFSSTGAVVVGAVSVRVTGVSALLLVVGAVSAEFIGAALLDKSFLLCR